MALGMNPTPMMILGLAISSCATMAFNADPVMAFPQPKAMTTHPNPNLPAPSSRKPNADPSRLNPSPYASLYVALGVALAVTIAVTLALILI